MELLNEEHRTSLGGELVYRRPPPVAEEMRYKPSLGTDHTVDLLVIEIQSGKHCVIGLYGGRGIGKTIVLRKVNKRLSRSEHMEFKLVIWVDASTYESDMSNTIDQIAIRVLKDHDNETPWKELSEKKILDRIHAELSHMKFLLILDGVRCEIDLYEIGVLIQYAENGSKVLLASRSLDVCHSMKAGMRIEVPTLSEDDAWKLFCNEDNILVADLEKRRYAEDVCRQCHGVPEELVVIGSCTKKATTLAEWKECWELEPEKRWCWEKLHGFGLMPRWRRRLDQWRCLLLGS